MTMDALASAERVRIDVVASSKKRALQIAAGLLAGAFDGLSENTIFNALVAREKLGSTSLGHGVALPHAAIRGIQTGAVAALKLKEPLVFDSDSTPVSLIVALVIPATEQGTGNDILQHCCDLLSQGDYRRHLLEADTSTQLYDALRDEFRSDDLRRANG